MPGLEQVQSTTLANGMKVIVWTDRDIPNVALYNWVRVGSRNEVPGITGLAHFFEHMMFNGTRKRAPGEFDRLMEAQGGSNNAFTSDDVTVYQDWIPRTRARAGVRSRVRPPRQPVVRSQGRSRASAAWCIPSAGCASTTTTRASSPSRCRPRRSSRIRTRFPTIGWPADIQGWKLEDLQKFFKTNYAPNNCTLVLVGDVSAEEVFALAKKYLEPIPRQEPPPPVRTVEPEQLGEKRVFVEREAQTPLLYYAYKSPAANDPQGPAINLLMSILAEGDSSRLHRLLVEEKKLAIDVGGAFQEGFDPGLTWLQLTLPEGAKLAEVEQRARCGARRRSSRRASPTPSSRAPRISTPRRSGSSSPPSTARRAC